MEQINWNIVFETVSELVLLIAIIAVAAIVSTAVGLWIIDRMEQKKKRRELYERHREIWDGRPSTELIAWLKVQSELQERNANRRMMALVKECITECRRRHETCRQIMLRTGRIVKVTESERR